MTGKVNTVVATLWFLLFSTAVMATPLKLAKDGQGWTIFTPSSDSRICYVSSSEGDDSQATHYIAGDSLIGDDPFNPVGTIIPFATYEEAFNHTRDGYPDWILFKRGESFSQVIGFNINSGRSATEPFFIGAYGRAGKSPVLKTGSSSGLAGSDLSFFAMSGLEFYAHTRNPSDPGYQGGDGSSGFRFVAGSGDSITGMLFEGCRFRFYRGNSIQTYQGDRVGDIVIRRCLFADNYSDSSHSQGLYTSKVDNFLLEENIFVHNGWLVQQDGSGNSQDGGQATMFNHNTYFTNSTNVTFSGNIFLLPSSIGTKWTANDGFQAKNIVMEDNLFVDGEIGVSMGGNTEEALRFVNPVIRDNIITDIGRSRPTNRTLGWGIDAQDWDGGLIEGNILMHQPLETIRNTYGINVLGTTRNVTIRKNIIHNVRFADGLNLSDSRGSNATNMIFADNIISLGIDSGHVIDAAYDPRGKWRFSGNRYFSDREPEYRFRLQGNRITLGEWRQATGDNSTFENNISFPDPDRNIEQYQKRINGQASIDSFVSSCRRQSRFSWDSRYTAKKVNSWIRGGFIADFPWTCIFPIILKEN